MENRQRKLKRLKLLRDTSQSKEHFKMYKVRKTWLFAGITVLFFGTGIFFGHPSAYADTVTNEPTIEALATVLHLQWQVLKVRLPRRVPQQLVTQVRPLQVRRQHLVLQQLLRVRWLKV
ncbi:KxYKxGKxW signal peptide domain-containing protein [Pediococcus parvulus]|uniref:KxYKxGKxW signal peptide domain-containing protein n=1 Tax=Pediococcus parvulus TaxID=54062 RepID=UPI003D037730